MDHQQRFAGGQQAAQLVGLRRARRDQVGVGGELLGDGLALRAQDRARRRDFGLLRLELIPHRLLARRVGLAIGLGRGLERLGLGLAPQPVFLAERGVELAEQLGHCPALRLLLFEQCAQRRRGRKHAGRAVDDGALGGTEAAAIGDLQGAVGQRRVDRLALDGALRNITHELIEGDAEHIAAHTAQVEVEPATGAVERGSEQRFVVGQGTAHIAAQQPHDRAHTGRFLRLRMVRAVQPKPVLVDSLDGLERLVKPPVLRRQQRQQTPVGGARAGQHIGRHRGEEFAVRGVGLGPAPQADQRAHHLLAREPAHMAGSAGAIALQHVVGQARRRQASFVLLGRDQAGGQAVVPARTQAVADLPGAPQGDVCLRHVDGLLRATLAHQRIDEHAERAIEPAVGVEHVRIARVAAARARRLMVAPTQADRLAQRGHGSGLVALKALDLGAHLEPVERQPNRHRPALLQRLAGEIVGARPEPGNDRAVVAGGGEVGLAQGDHSARAE